VARPLLSSRALAQRLPAATLVALGVFALYKASSLTFGSVREPGSGFFPTLISVSLVTFAAALFLFDRRPRLDGEGEDLRAERSPWIVVAAVAAYALALKHVGFILCTAALILLLLRGIGAVSWRLSLAIAVAATLACHALFTRLGVPLPAGVLGLW